MTKTELIAKLKTEYPVLRSGNEEEGYVDLSVQDYNLTIENWADNLLEKEAEKAKLLESKLAKAQLLEKLGITQEEAELLLSQQMEQFTPAQPGGN
jgi:hypothetical protein